MPDVQLKHQGFLTVAFTGHRPPKCGGYDFHDSRRDYIRNTLRSVLQRLQLKAKQQGLECQAITGGALGFDHDALGVTTEMSWPNCVAEPHLGHGLSKKEGGIWFESSCRTYKDLLQRGTSGERWGIWNAEEELAKNPRFLFGKVVVISPGGYEAPKMQRRNEWMVDNADLLVCLWDGSPGGTANCVNYARRRTGMPIIQLNCGSAELGITTHFLKL